MANQNDFRIAPANMSNSVSGRAYSANNGAGHTLKHCECCGREVYQAEPRMAIPGNCAVSVTDGKTGKVRWFLPLGTPIFGGSKRGSVANAFKDRPNFHRGEYKLPTKATDWVPVQGPCQQVTLRRDAPKQWKLCRECYKQSLVDIAARTNVNTTEIVVRRKGKVFREIQVPDEVLKAKIAKARQILKAMPPERAKRKPATTTAQAVNVVKEESLYKASIMNSEGIVKGYTVGAFSRIEAKKLLAEDAGISLDKFSSTIYKQDNRGDWIRLN